MVHHIPIGENLFFTEIRKSDREKYVEYFKDREIYENTLQIPFPYSLAHADEWIALNERWAHEEPRLVHFAIRDGSGLLLGGADFHNLKPGESHKAEIGYWLAKRFWGRGYMSAVVGKLLDIGFNEFNLKRITAITFASNVRSQRCLEKNGFEYEGYLRNYYLKDGNLMDAKLYSKIPQFSEPKLAR